MSEIIPLVLEWFPKNGKNDYIVGEEVICIDLDLAIKLINIDKEFDPIFADSYKLNIDISRKIQKYFEHRINFKKFIYFATSYSDIVCP